MSDRTTPLVRAFMGMSGIDDPRFQAVLSTMAGEFGDPGSRWEFRAVDQADGSVLMLVEVQTQADWDTMKSYSHIEMLP